MSDENRNSLERQARALLVSREISGTNRARINNLMKNQELDQEERFSSIIRILRDAPEKELVEIDDAPPEPEEKSAPKKMPVKTPGGKASLPALKDIPSFPDINGPTETKLYINDIYLKHKKYKFFKKRYLVERNNRIGFGFRKRLVPSRKLLLLFSEIRSFQELILSRLPSILEAILKNESIEGPLEFNYLRLLRRWMLDSPLSAMTYDRVKWMEQWGFEREFKSYIVNFFSFMRIDQEHRERILLLVENLLRDEPDLVKEEIGQNEEKSFLAGKEKRNYTREKQIFEYMGALRSFIALPGEADSLVAKSLRKKYGIYTLEDLINMVVEALIFQRPYSANELRIYYEIRTIAVSSDKWDYSQDKLKKFGKDPESRKERRVMRLKSELLWFDAVYQMLNIKDNGQNILLRSADEQWKLADRINRDAGDSESGNFIVYLEGLVNYFRNLIHPLLNGQPVTFQCSREEVSGALFTPSYFESELRDVESLNEEIYIFRNNNPTLKISREEVDRIISGKISSMTHVERLLFKAGSVFYNLASALHEVYHSHLTAHASGQGGGEPSRIPLDRDDEEAALPGRIIPFSSCRFKDFEDSTPLARRIEGRKIINESLKGGILIFITAYCYQLSNLCGYAKIRDDMTRRDVLRREIEVLKEERYDS